MLVSAIGPFSVVHWCKSWFLHSGMWSRTISKQPQMAAQLVSLQLHHGLDQNDVSHLWQLTRLTALTIGLPDKQLPDGSHSAQGVSSLVHLRTLHLAQQQPFSRRHPFGQTAAVHHAPNQLNLANLTKLTSLQLHSMSGSLSIASTVRFLQVLAIDNSQSDSVPHADQALKDRMRQLAALQEVQYQGKSLLQVVNLLQNLPNLHCLNLTCLEGPQQTMT